MCGVYEIDWDSVIKVSKFLTTTSWTRWICSPNQYGAGLSSPVHHAIPNLIEATRRTQQMSKEDTMLYALIRSRRFRAADLRDKVYAVLGVAQDSVVDKQRFDPVYGTRTVSETYTTAAIQILEDSKDLLLLAHAEGDIFQTIPSLPSWVPDWSCPSVVGLGVTGYRRFDASRSIPRSLRVNEEANLLTVKGKRLDNIVRIGESKKDMLDGKPFERLLSMLCELPHPYHTGQPRAEVLWRTLITDTAGTPPVHPAPAVYGRAFASWFAVKLHSAPSLLDSHNLARAFELSKETEAKLFEAPWVLADFADTEGRGRIRGFSQKDVKESRDYEVAFSHAIHLRTFLTHKGYIGVGSESLHEDDSVWIVAGSRVPLMLRGLASGAYRIVGGAYVHGFMQGEGFGSDKEFIEITIA